jgi:glycosyltransferase involved in cell wall biosynthesis
MPRSRFSFIDGIRNAPIPFSPSWYHHIATIVEREKADCLIVRDLPLAPTAIAVGRRAGIPVHYDLADIYPVWFASNRPNHPLKRLLYSPTAAAWLERWVFDRAATVFVVSQESLDRCVSLGVPPERVVLVGNTPANLEDFRKRYPMPSELADWANSHVVLFVGNLLADRGLDFAIEAVADIRDKMDVRLLIVGDGPEMERLSARINVGGLESHVRLLGWREHSALPPFYANSTVGILPFAATPHIRLTIANKLFDYMAAGLPVVASDVPPMRRVLEETRSGILVKPESAAAIANSLLALLSQPQVLIEMGANGRRAVATKYSWHNDASRFVRAIEAAADRGTPSSETRAVRRR